MLPQDDPTLRLLTESKAAAKFPPIKPLSTYTTAYRKRIIHNIPFVHDGYNPAKAIWGDFYPQAFVVDSGADELFVIGNNSAATHQIVSVFSWSTGAYKTVFAIASAYVSEGAVILQEGASRFLYLRSTASGLSKYDMTALPAATSLIAATSTINTGQGINFTYRNGAWTVSDPTPPISLSESRGSFKRLDSAFAYIGQLNFPESISGGSTYKYRESALPKMQGIAEGPGYFAETVGGYYPIGAAVNPYHYNGIRIISGQGVVLADSLLDPSKMAPILNAAGVSTTRIENEGVQFVGDQIVTFNVAGTTTDGGMLFMEEFSTDPSALDFSPAGTVWTMPDVARMQSGIQPRTNDGKMYNQATNEVLDTLPKIIDYMKSVGQHVFSFYTSSVSITDINGAALPTGYLARIYNGNNSSFFMQLIGSQGLWYRINTSGSTLSQSTFTPGSGGTFAPDRDGIWALGSASNRWFEVYAKNGIVINSPDGTKYRVTVANGGALSTVVVP